MSKHNNNTPIEGHIVEHTTLTIDELSHAIRLQKTVIIEWVDHDILTPQGEKPEQWYFDGLNFNVASQAARMHKDLEVNTQGIKIILDLLERIEQLEAAR